MRWILHFRVCVIICLAVVLITAAVLFSVLRATLPYATGYKNEIQQELSQQIGLPVEIESIDAAIHWFSPRLRLIGVSVFDEKNKVPLFNFQEAFVELDVIASIMHRDILVDDVGLIGAELSIEKLSDNEWLVQGMRFTSEGSNELPEKFLYMIQNSNYLLHDSDIYYQDHTGEKLNLSLLDVNIDVKNNFNNHDVKFSMNLPGEYGENLAVVANLTGEMDSLEGEVYVEANQIDVKQWNQKFKILKSHDIDALVNINLWATIEDNDFQSLYVQLASENVSISNNETKKSWTSSFLQSNLRYLREDEHWNVAITELGFGNNLETDWHRPVNVLASVDDEYYHLSADFLRSGGLREAAEVFLNKQQLVKLSEIDKYQLTTDVYNLNLKYPVDSSDDDLFDKLVLDADIVDFSMYEASNDMRLSGIDASISYVENRFFVDVETQDAEISLNKLFRESIVAEVIQGDLRLAHSENGWQLNTESLQFKNSEINTFSRFDVQVDVDNRIFVDAQTDFYNAQAKYANNYLPVGIMKKGLIDWLDMAIIDGQVPEGTFILHGALDDFPYADNNGAFEVIFTAQDASLRFLKEWPLITGATAMIEFNNSSLRVSNGTASSGKTHLLNNYAEINNLLDPYLTVILDARGNNEDIQSYIWNSPLDEILGDAMRLFQIEGKSNLSLKLDVPLNEEEVDVVIDGHLNFIDTTMYYPTLGYGISKLNGVVVFTGDSIFADSLTGVVDNKEVSINVFTQDGEFGPENIFHLDGIIDSDYLLQRYDWMPEQWVSGESLWSVDISVPKFPKDYFVHVNARTFMQGVSSEFSDAVNKTAEDKLNFMMSIDVLADNGLHVDTTIRELKTSKSTAPIKDIVKLYAIRNESDIWSFDIKTKFITGKGEFAEGLGKETSVELDLSNIDLHSLFFSVEKKHSKPLLPSTIPPLNWKAKNVLWDDWVFSDVALNTTWHEHGMLINALSLKGPAMSFTASGTWLTSWRAAHETVLQGKMSSDNLGETLSGLGFERSIDRSEYTATFDAKWSAEPYGWSWANMKGKTSFEMENGEILEVNPGAGGRLLGLLNIFKLTNRLALDFDDVTRDGFAFDSIKGEFEFVNGDGSLKNFDVSAPAADINMFGSIGLIERDYGLLMRVKPHTDTLTFAGAAILGGVVVGAGLALLQKVFDLSVVGHNVYSITGSWDDPQIEQIIEKAEDTTEDDDF